jgi:competence protein ComEC
MERPLAVPLLALMLGLALAGTRACFVPGRLLLPFLALTLLTLFFRSRLPFLAALALLMFTCGNLLLEPYQMPHLPPDHIAGLESDEPATIEGAVVGRPEITEQGCRLTVRADEVYRDNRRARISGLVLLTVGAGTVPLETGDRVRFASRIRKPRNFGLPGEFDQAGRLAARGIYATAFVTDPGGVILIRAGVEQPWRRSVDRVAERVGSFIDRTVPPAEGAILRALLIGDKGHLSRATRDAYGRAGVSHILSISGFHVGVVALFAFQLLFFAARRSRFLLLHLNLRRGILILTLPPVVFYLFLSGAAPSTTRSVIMIAVYIAALALGRDTDPINSLMLAALVILVLSPPALFDISFQLSFLAVWGIIVLTPLFMAPFPPGGDGVRRKLLLFFMASAAATAATLPMVAWHFHQVSFTGLIGNFFIVPLMGYGAVVLGCAALPFIPLAPPVAGGLLTVAAWLVKLATMIVVRLAALPTFTQFNPSRLDLLLFLLLLIGMTFIRAGKGRAACCCALALVVAGTAFTPEPGRGSLEVWFLSVGQGESTLITLPDGKRMLVDGGGSGRAGVPDTGERLLAPALRKLGVRRIDYMVLSHPHPDHMQGLRFVVDTFPVGEFWQGNGPAASPEHYALLRKLFEHQVPLRRLDAAAAPFSAGGALVEPLSPPIVGPAAGAEDDEGDDLNDTSLVFRLTYGGFRMLFTGDIGTPVEERLLAHPKRLKCTLLKVAHHGSRYSSSLPFLRAAAPETALIGAGYRNSFHLPARETLDTLARLGIRVYRTDRDGTIRAVSDGSEKSPLIEKISGHFN